MNTHISSVIISTFAPRPLHGNTETQPQQITGRHAAQLLAGMFAHGRATVAQPYYGIVKMTGETYFVITLE